MTHKHSAARSGAGRPLLAALATASLALAIPAAAFADEQHGGAMSGAPHAGMGGMPHGGGGHVGPVGGHPGGGPGGAPGGSRGGPAPSGGVYRGYDGVLPHDEHGNAGDRRGFGNSFDAGRRFHGGAYHRPPGWYPHRWIIGDILPALFWAQDFWLTDYWIYDLSPPPYGYVWVRDGTDALLIDRQTGEVVEVIYGVFY